MGFSPNYKIEWETAMLERLTRFDTRRAFFLGSQDYPTLRILHKIDLKLYNNQWFYNNLEEDTCILLCNIWLIWICILQMKYHFAKCYQVKRKKICYQIQLEIVGYKLYKPFSFFPFSYCKRFQNLNSLI